MKLSPKDAARVAKLARLEFDDAALEKVSGELDQILNYMDKLAEVDTEGVEPLYTPVEHVSRLREDEVRKDVKREDVLSNAPEDDGQFFIVPKIVS